MPDSPVLTFPATRIDDFKQHYRKSSGLRVGQAFYQFMELEKTVQDKAFVEALYQADGDKAWAMILSVADYNN